MKCVRFKPGDVVKVRDDLKGGKYYYALDENDNHIGEYKVMGILDNVAFAGRYVTIYSEIGDDKAAWYRIFENGSLMFVDEMFDLDSVNGADKTQISEALDAPDLEGLFSEMVVNT